MSTTNWATAESRCVLPLLYNCLIAYVLTPRLNAPVLSTLDLNTRYQISGIEFSVPDPDAEASMSYVIVNDPVVPESLPVVNVLILPPVSAVPLITALTSPVLSPSDGNSFA